MSVRLIWSAGKFVAYLLGFYSFSAAAFAGGSPAEKGIELGCAIFWMLAALFAQWEGE